MAKAKRKSWIRGVLGYLHLADGTIAVVDASDLPRVSQYNWHMCGGYVARRHRRRVVLLHHEIVGRREGLVVDHANRDPRDNRRANLRFATPSQSSSNRRSGGTSAGFRGVQPQGRGFVARLHVNGESRYLGYFKTAEAAARAYNEAATNAFADFACTNAIGFPPMRRLGPVAGTFTFRIGPEIEIDKSKTRLEDHDAEEGNE